MVVVVAAAVAVPVVIVKYHFNYKNIVDASIPSLFEEIQFENFQIKPLVIDGEN